MSYTDTTSGYPPTQHTSKANLAKNRKLSKNFKYVVFEQASEYTTDPFWVTRLMLASRGYMPQYFRISGNTIHYCAGKAASKNKSVKFSSDPEEVCEIFVNFLKNASGIMSDTDIERDRTYTVSSKSTNSSWKISDNSKFRLIDNYVDQYFSYHMCVNIPFRNYTKEFLKTSMLTGMLNNTRVEISNGRITHINDLVIDFMNLCVDFDERAYKLNERKLKTEYGKCSYCNDDFSNRLHKMHIPEMTSKKRGILSQWDKTT